MGDRISSPHIVTVAATGTQVTSGAATANVAIPNAADGNKARYVRVTALASLYVKPGLSAVTATANDMLLPAGTSEVLNVHGMTHIAYIQETAAAKLSITPLEVA